MIKTLLFYSVLLLTLCYYSTASAQQKKITGKVTDGHNGESLSAVTISIKGKSIGTFSDESGNFSLNYPSVNDTLVISSVGYESMLIPVRTIHNTLEIKLRPSEVLGSEVVVSASRVPQNILESPVSVEHLGIRQLKNIPDPSFYDAITHFKGVDVSSSSLLFRSIRTRGFGTIGNTRFNQYLDGMDNAAPGLNFPVSNLLGISPLDVQDVELLPGVSSALYGAGGTNGALIITSKDPFQYQGLSFELQEGVMHVADPAHSASPYGNYMIRFDKAFNNKWAFKVNASYIKAQDWQADDERDYDRANDVIKNGTRNTDPAYDGINVYGDEVSANMRSVAQALAQNGLIPASAVSAAPDTSVSRTGYKENALEDYDTYNLKLNAEVDYKLSSKLTAKAEAYFGTGTTIYTGADRYSLSDFKMGQYKLELKSDNFYLRAYTTQENAGNAYNSTVLAELINERWKPSTTWFPQYVAAYILAKSNGQSDMDAYNNARDFADEGRLMPGTSQFNEVKDSISSLAIPQGARFDDKTSLWHYEGLYNFSSLVHWLDIIAGASYRKYHLNSEGSLFADKNGRKLTINELGLFTQVTKRLINDRLKLTASLRFDKNENFKGRLTPRIAGVVTVAKDNNIRLSYQTGYRNPSNQEQYIDLNVGTAHLLGGLPEFRSTYNFNDNPVYTLPTLNAYGAAFQQYYAQAYAAAIQEGHSSSEASAIASASAATQAQPVLKPYDFKSFKPEGVQSYEIGYRGLVHKRLMIDAYYYYSIYDDFIGIQALVQSKPVSGPPSGPALLSGNTRQVYAIPVNNPTKVDAHGWALGLDWLLPKNFQLNTNVSYNHLGKVDKGFETFYNTPEYRFNIGLGNDNVYKNIGFNIAYRYQQSFYYESNFGNGQIAAYGTVDAQINYKILRWKAMIKLGGSNITNHYYVNAFGNPSIGGLYYLSLGYNIY